MELGVDTIRRVRDYWQGWEARGDESASVSIVLIGDDRFTRAPAPLHGLLATHAPTDLASLLEALGDGIGEVVGEAGLAYADQGTLRLSSTDQVIEVGAHAVALAALESTSDRREWLEASADEPCDRRFGIEHEGFLLAVATLSVWDDTLGHVGVFTAVQARGLGLARDVGSAAIEYALSRGSVPQWRARIGNEASARVAARLGFVALGRQMTVRVRAGRVGA